MRLCINFGTSDSQKLASWGKKLSEFPMLLSFRGKNWEWVFYDRDTTMVNDYILTFSEVPMYDTRYSIYAPTLEIALGMEVEKCECGARFSSFPFDHMRMCKLWKPW